MINYLVDHITRSNGADINLHIDGFAQLRTFNPQVPLAYLLQRGLEDQRVGNDLAAIAPVKAP